MPVPSSKKNLLIPFLFLFLFLFLFSGCLFKETQRKSNATEPGFVLSALSGNTTEAGGAAYFTVALTTAPTIDVTLSPQTTNYGEGSVAPSSIIITPTNWKFEKTVKVTGVDDTTRDGDIKFSVTLAISPSSDIAYRSLTAPKIDIINKDNELEFQFQAYLKAPNAQAGDAFGNAPDISGDTLVVGAVLEDSNQTTITNGTTASSDNSRSDSGAAYVFKRTGTSWAQEAYLKASNADVSDHFGWDNAISGDTIVVTANSESSNQTTITNGTTASSDNSASSSGAAYVYRRTGTTWAQEAYLKASNAESSDNFGESVAISGDTIVVVALSEDSNQTTITNGGLSSSNNAATGAGAVYVFKRTSDNLWIQEAYLKGANTEANDIFGSSVDIYGDTIVVGANGEDSNQHFISNSSTGSADNSSSSAGAAYVFRRSSSLWTQEAYLKPPNPDTSDGFGSAVAISGDTLAVGATNEASSQITVTNGPSGSANNSLPGAGAVYVFKRSGTVWAQEAYLKASNAGTNDTFGRSLDIDGDIIVVGADAEDSEQRGITNGDSAASDNNHSASGAAYIFKRNGVNWAQTAYIKSPNSDPSDQLGYHVALSGETVVVGSFGEDSNQTTITNGTTASADNSALGSGAAYVIVNTNK